jgi:hypothetical protein
MKKEHKARQSLDVEYISNLNKLSLEEKIKIESEILFINQELPPIPKLNYDELARDFVSSIDQEKINLSLIANEDFEAVLQELIEYILNELRNICVIKKMLPKVEAFSDIKYYCLMEDYFNENKQNFILLLDYCFAVLKEQVIEIHNELIINVNMVVEYVNTYKHSILDEDFLDYLAKQAIYFK